MLTASKNTGTRWHAGDMSGGIEPDISEMLSEDTLKLEPGDCMVLFTDGITEAWDKKGNMFGNERLVKIIEESEDRPASGIHGNIINAIEPYRRDDDVTLVVVKHLELGTYET